MKPTSLVVKLNRLPMDKTEKTGKLVQTVSYLQPDRIFAALTSDRLLDIKKTTRLLVQAAVTAPNFTVTLIVLPVRLTTVLIVK